MYDIKLAENGDIAIDKGDISLVDSLKQSIEIKLRWFLGEWKFNPDFGIPYYEEIFTKQVSIERIEAIVEDALLVIDGISSIDAIDVSYYRQERRLSVHFAVTGENGTVKEEVNIIVYARSNRQRLRTQKAR